MSNPSIRTRATNKKSLFARPRKLPVSWKYEFHDRVGHFEEGFWFDWHNRWLPACQRSFLLLSTPRTQNSRFAVFLEWACGHVRICDDDLISPGRFASRSYNYVGAHRQAWLRAIVVFVLTLLG